MTKPHFLAAVQDFRRARRQAALQQIFSRLTGRPDTLLPYEEVRAQAGTRSQADRGLQEIPLDSIVGSVGRYADFTRSFLPRSDAMEQRWARVKAVATGMEGWPPIEVYQLGDTYFVADGHHRVSVARQMGQATIPAYVTEVKTKVPLTPEDDLEDVIIRSRLADFLEETGLDTSRPGADLLATEAGAYYVLSEHVRVHRHYMGVQQQREIPYEEAAQHWYDTVYLPVVTVIRERGILREFPDRTETDLYLWLAEHRAELESALGWEVAPDAAAEDLVSRHGATPHRMLARVGEKLLDVISIGDLEPGPPPGEWRSLRQGVNDARRIFPEILVAVNGGEGGWRTLEQAIVVARREDSVIRGLHVVPVPEAGETLEVQEFRDRFQWRLGEVGINGRLVVEQGDIVHTICDRARWNDLVALPLTHPPGGKVLERLSSGFRSVVQRCPRPVLAVPRETTAMKRALLAYDASAKALEALYVSTYLAARWEIELVVLTVGSKEEKTEEILDSARAYLEEHGVKAQYEAASGRPATAIVETADQQGCDFLVLGGYGASPVVEIVLGSELNEVLRRAMIPILICR